MATADSLTDRLTPVFDHSHDTVTTAIVLGFAAVLGLYASWLAADVGARFSAFLVTAVALAYLLYAQPTRRTVVAGGLYSLAALLAATPVFYELVFLLNSGRPGVGPVLEHYLSLADVILFAVFWLLAAVPTLVAYRLTTGPFVPRLRSRFGG
jgi:hypothetical protein